jgi:hypothetical protein
VPPPTRVAFEKSREPRGTSTSRRPSLPLMTSGPVVVGCITGEAVGFAVGVGVTVGKVVVAVGVAEERVVAAAFVAAGVAGVVVDCVVTLAGIAVPLARKELSRATVTGCMLAGSALGGGGVDVAVALFFGTVVLALARAAEVTPKVP